MRRICLLAAAVISIMSAVSGTQAQGSKKLVAHRGASAYAPEHTLAAYRLAMQQHADYVEQDLAVTKDGVLICLHDESLERTTNVEDILPDRSVVDPAAGRKQWLAIDFTLAEIKRLDAGSWFDTTFTGERIPTWEEAVAVVGTAAGLYPELKTPGLYRSRGVDQTTLFAESATRLGLDRRAAGSIIVQSFDDQPLRDLTRRLPAIPRTFLIDTRDGGKWLTKQGLADIARFATGIGPAKGLLDGRPEIVKAAHEAGLTVTPYTFTTRAPASASARFSTVTDEMRYYLSELNVDAIFTDNPDLFPRATR
ncbi:MAG TPA: glycerophosphodiester phosphodiesterase family protein [Vicinamibacterales bacterium]|nr:glycerophosphodiester phosphodiesterase family protein [Vicinamibacterales bacterium]